MRPPKPHQTHDQLIMGLEANGLRIKDKVAARQALRKHGYHRLSGYRYLFRELLPIPDQNQSLRTFRGKKHIPGTSFEQVIALAEFDRDLRMMVLRATEDFEVRLRTAVAHLLAAYDPYAYAFVDYLDKQTTSKPVKRVNCKTSHEAFMKEVEKAKKAALNEGDNYVKHHTQKYGDLLPVWAIVEYLSFGSLVFLLTYLKAEDQRTIAAQFGMKHPKIFVTIVRAMAELRNKAAHGTRLFNKVLKIELKPRRTDFPAGSYYLDTWDLLEKAPAGHIAEGKRVFVHASLLAYMLNSHESQSTWPCEFSGLMSEFPPIFKPGETEPFISPEHQMGFPTNWQSALLWA
ncbi:Abi family protein [uncultured Corynebacterium sp.]|uniref:Abi family protein n=1 Tax=uncultured Corynebacterium sp. TaxID=159447 RepID=UPI00259A7791|nr:Abi family protein [uncultured Corynebacterium sp.]